MEAEKRERLGKMARDVEINRRKREGLPGYKHRWEDLNPESQDWYCSLAVALYAEGVREKQLELDNLRKDRDYWRSLVPIRENDR